MAIATGTSRPARRPDVLEAEKRVDAEFQKLRLPTANKQLSKWHLLTAFEDSLRNVLWMITRDATTATNNTVPSGFNSNIDRYKYVLRYAFDRIAQEQPDTSVVPSKPQVIPEAYRRSATLLERGDDHLFAARAFSSYYAGNATARINGDLLELAPLAFSNVYSALDQFVQSVDETGGPITALMRAFFWPDLPEFCIVDFTARTRIDAGRISYHYDPFLCNQLIQAIPKPPTIVPKSWRFPWGNAEDAHHLFEALHARCLVHLLSVHFGAIRFELDGYGVDDICPLFAKDKLILDLAELTNLDKAEVARFVTAMSYGAGTNTPDPALQPLIPLSTELLLAPTILILSSHFPRNFLSLHARIDSKSFDAQSHQFETHMSEEVEREMRPKFRHLRMHSTLPTKKDAGEIDLLVADEATRTVLIGELRWLLPPGDPREVNNRKKVCAEKVLQLKKKVEAAQAKIDWILDSFDIVDRSMPWQTVGVVLVTGYVSAGPIPAVFPVVPMELFLLSLKHCTGLMQLHHWLTTEKWLPQQGTDFTSGTITRRFGKQRLRWGGLRVLPESRYLHDFVTQASSLSAGIND